MMNTQPLPSYDTPPNSVQEMKDRVIELIDKGWIQRKMAIDQFGNSVDEREDNVYGVCLLGAFLRARVSIECSQSYIDFGNALDCKLETMGYYTKLAFNDDNGTTKEDVLELVQSV